MNIGDEVERIKSLRGFGRFRRVVGIEVFDIEMLASERHGVYGYQLEPVKLEMAFRKNRRSDADARAARAKSGSPTTLNS